MAYSEYSFDLTPRSYGEMHISATAPTVITTPGTFVKAAGTTVQDSVYNFAMSGNNRLICSDFVTGNYILTTTLSAQTTANNNTISAMIYKNGIAQTYTEVTTRLKDANTPDNIVLNQIINLTKDDFVEVWVTNLTATNSVTVIKMILTLVKI